MKQTLKLKEIVVMAMLSALMGVVFMGLDSVYQPLTTIAGPLGEDIIYGVYLISALLSMYIVRKPGAGIIGSLFTGLVNLLMGSPYGIHIIVASLLQGAGVEIAVAIKKYSKFSYFQMSIASILAMILVTMRDYFIFGFSLYPKLIPIMLVIRVVSSIIFGAGLSIALGKDLKSTGVLNDFKISRGSES
ncbi:putative HMP/thiamine permease protein YkoE [Clostridium sporogenes]|uniref:ECF transporter S component n=1 Tax=Clostridium botulinum TaxID=1491 RepID=UPI0007177697|nr:ECF transporter S component [Clostridium botulinum]KRU30600.1 putative HMP/thiamine permease protein YkoE [Clostridium sporogenes]KRU31635.1 putative HMP/thiamine permease protein YkoE [Clostridium sporogenes]KRU33105.1 putative HMP/thiamine permease protein YkoE [Clostridium sporogenes]KRU38818.1 putative HMP/thiamine permease protein YkoE [Clostridium sporogenes]MBZ1330161.1 ECF transporter S component [Clostridium botulinum]